MRLYTMSSLMPPVLTLATRYMARLPSHRVSWIPHVHSRKYITRTCTPYIYDTSTSAWRNVKPLEQLDGLSQGQTLSLISWNVDCSSPCPKSRIAALLGHLEQTFVGLEREMVIFLQEVCHASLSQLLKTEWLFRNFAIIGLPPPIITQDGTNKPARYFNLILTPRAFAVQNSFSLPLPSEMGRDALFVDLPINPDRGGVIRLCTTHLESLEIGGPLRKKQLQLISLHLRGKEEQDPVVLGVIGGDFNSIHDYEHSQPAEFDLVDAWSVSSELSSPDHGSGTRTGGYTWGYQSSIPNHYLPRRFDKFLCTRTKDINPILGPGGRLDTVQRFGSDINTDIDIDEDATASRLKTSVWVSDHLGIKMTVKIP